MLSTGHLDRLQCRVISHIPHTKSSKSSRTIRRDIGLQRLPSCFDRSTCLPAGGGFVSFTSVRNIWHDPQKTMRSQHILYMRNYRNACI